MKITQCASREGLEYGATNNSDGQGVSIFVHLAVTRHLRGAGSS